MGRVRPRPRQHVKVDFRPSVAINTAGLFYFTIMSGDSDFVSSKLAQNILVCQSYFADACFSASDIDIIDMCVLEAFRGCILAGRMKSKKFGDYWFYQVNPASVIKRLPYSGLRTEKDIWLRIEKLCRIGLLSEAVDSNNCWFGFGEKFSLVFQ